MKGMIIAIIIVAVIGAFAWFFYASNQTKTEDPAAITQELESTDADHGHEEGVDEEHGHDGDEEEFTEGAEVAYTDSGFRPQSVTVKSGGSLTWVNDSSSTVQVGSANHPTHTINQQLTGDEFFLELAPGESKTVQLTKTGNWGYHDHLKSSMTGTIIVE